jgi:hypothetical protein
MNALALAAAVIVCGLAVPESAVAQAKKDKAPKAETQSAPAKPKITPGADPGGVAVAIIGTGVNYTLPFIASRLARDGEGDIIGLDFVDRDNRPFDVAGPDATPDGIRPMGTTLASVLLAEAPRARLIPVRLKMGEPRAFGGAAAFVASTPARIAIVAFSSTNRADWEPFEQAAKAAPHVLFVIPAGDGGQDLDKVPLYPASLGLPNAIVVTAGIRGGLRVGANFGAETIDVGVVFADDFPALSADGRPVFFGGSGYAAAFLAALAVTQLSANPKWTTDELKAWVFSLSAGNLKDAPRWTRYGWYPYQCCPSRF